MEPFLEIISERCAACDKPIVPSMQVAIAWIGAPRPYTHMECAEAAGLKCGVWGFGQLIRLHHLDKNYNEEAATLAHDTEIDELRALKEMLGAEQDTAEIPIAAEDDDEPPDDAPPSKPGAN